MYSAGDQGRVVGRCGLAYTLGSAVFWWFVLLVGDDGCWRERGMMGAGWGGDGSGSGSGYRGKRQSSNTEG